MMEIKGEAELSRMIRDRAREEKKYEYPKYVVARKKIISFRPRINPKYHHLFSVDKTGFISPPFVLGFPSDPETKIIKVYNDTVKALLSTMFPIDKEYGTLNWLLAHYLTSTPFKKLKPDTQKDYELKLRKLTRFELLIGRRRSTAGSIKIEKFNDVSLLRKFYDKVLEAYQEAGMDGRSTVNGQFRCLSSMLSYGLQYHKDIGVQFNPCHLIKKEPENKRDRYVTDQEYWQQFEFACAMGYEYLPIFFEHAYLLAGRTIEICSLTLDSVTEDGYLVERTKGSKTNLVLWSPRLKNAYDAAIRLREQRIKNQYCKQIIVGNHLLTSRSGPIRRETIKSVMSRLKQSMTKSGLGHVYWTLHDLKRKGISDATNKNIGGHKTIEMQQRYNTVVEAFEPPTKGTEIAQKTIIRKT